MKYQIKKYFQWGSLKLEPSQYLLVRESKYPNSVTVILEKTNETIEVSNKAFQNYVSIGFIQKA